MSKVGNKRQRTQDFDLDKTDSAKKAKGNNEVTQQAAGDMSGLGDDALGTLDGALQQGVRNQAAIALAQAKASTAQFAVGAALQELNSTLHMAENAVATAVKFQNKMSDDAKDAI